MRKVVMTLVTVLLFCHPANAQGQNRKADASVLATLTSIDDGVSSAMEMEGAGINFSRWDAPIALIDAYKNDYESQRMKANTLHSMISQIKSTGIASSPQLFVIYADFRDIRETLVGFEMQAQERQRDTALAIDLTQKNTDLIAKTRDLRDVVTESIAEDASDLGSCR
jgi:hypothetical protein